MKLVLCGNFLRDKETNISKSIFTFYVFYTAWEQKIEKKYLVTYSIATQMPFSVSSVMIEGVKPAVGLYFILRNFVQSNHINIVFICNRNDTRVT